MPHDGSVELFWGEGVTRFRLGIDELLALEDRFDVGVASLLDGFRSGAWRLRHAREILRSGLLGAGAGMEVANREIDRWFDKMGIAPLEHAHFALAVLTAGVVGPVGDDLEASALGEPAAEATATGANASSPPRSTAPAPS